MKLIERSYYLKQLQDVIGTPDIKVITGIRRCGKSKLLEAFLAYIADNISDANIIHINYNLSEFEDIAEYHRLNAFVENAYLPGRGKVTLRQPMDVFGQYQWRKLTTNH